MCDTRSASHDRPRVVVIGCGNPDRRDDGAGPELVRQLDVPGVEVRLCTSDMLDLMELWAGFDTAIVVDACVEAGPAERVRPLCHSLDLAKVIELARILGRAPQHLVVLTIPGRDFGQGPGLSAAATEEISKCRANLLDVLGECGLDVSACVAQNKRPRSGL